MAEGTREQRAQDKKRRLLDAAERVFFRDGDLGLTVRRLAAEGSTTSQTIYTYFGSRDAVVDGLYARTLADLDDLLTVCEERVGHGDVADVVAPYRAHATERPGQFRMMAEGRGPVGTDPAGLIDRRRRLVDLLAKDGNLVVPAEVALAAVDGFIGAELHETLEHPDQGDELFRSLVAALSTAP